MNTPIVAFRPQKFNTPSVLTSNVVPIRAPARLPQAGAFDALTHRLVMRDLAEGRLNPRIVEALLLSAGVAHDSRRI
jgi:hypothetical protein